MVPLVIIHTHHPQMMMLVVPDTTGDVVDDQGAAALAVLRALGAPTTLAAVATDPTQPPPRNAVEALKRRAAVKKHVGAVLHAQGLADCGVYWLAGDVDQGGLLRQVGSAPLTLPAWRTCRPAMVVEGVEAVEGLVGIRCALGVVHLPFGGGQQGGGFSIV